MQTARMSVSSPIFRPLEATRKSFWNHRGFSVWVNGGTLCGAENYKHSNSSGAIPFELLPLGLEMGLVGIVISLLLLALLLPVALIIGANSRRKQEQALKGLAELDPTSDEYMRWSEHNFCLSLGDIQKVEFSEPIFQSLQNLRLHLPNDQHWDFSLNSRQEADQLRAILEEKGVAVKRLDRKSLFQRLMYPSVRTS